MALQLAENEHSVTLFFDAGAMPDMGEQ